MGIDSSKDYILIKKNNELEPSLLKCNSLSSYKGMKSEHTEKNSDNSDTTKQTTEQDDKITSVEIEWTEGGKKVLLTGNFAHWNQFFLMTKDTNNGIFKVRIQLPKEKIQFKFVVDDQWRCSMKYPTMNDGYYTNNYIDLSEGKVKKQQREENVINISNNNNKPNLKLGNKDVKENCYAMVYPERKDMNPNAPHVPLHYLNLFGINYNTKQNIIGKGKFLKFKTKNNNDENKCYLSILSSSHVNLNHIISSSTQKRYLCTGGAIRVRNKDITFIYYKPLKKGS